MAIWNLGSINEDIVYSVPHVPRPGETLAATEKRHYIGGKGANMSASPLVGDPRLFAQRFHLFFIYVSIRPVCLCGKPDLEECCDACYQAS